VGRLRFRGLPQVRGGSDAVGTAHRRLPSPRRSCRRHDARSTT
jgi:hypothetical protein